MSDHPVSLDHAAAGALRSLTRIAEQLIDTRPVQAALSQAFAARDRLTQIQEATLAALNLPTAAESERITRRVRSVAQQIEGLEDAVDRIEQHLRSTAANARPEQDLAAISAQLAALQERLDELSDRGAVTSPDPEPGP